MVSPSKGDDASGNKSGLSPGRSRAFAGHTYIHKPWHLDTWLDFWGERRDVPRPVDPVSLDRGTVRSLALLSQHLRVRIERLWKVVRLER